MKSEKPERGPVKTYESPRFRIVRLAAEPQVTTTISSSSARPLDEAKAPPSGGRP